MEPLERPSFYLPLIDIGPYLQDPTSPAAQSVIENVRKACISTGFFQLTGHGVPPALQKNLFSAAEKFFALSSEEKLRLDARNNVGFRGYDPITSQSYEQDVMPDLREGFLVGTDISADNPKAVKKRFFMGPNVWPPNGLLTYEEFQKPIEEYYNAVAQLGWVILYLISATFPYGPEAFEGFKDNEPACPLRLLFYPPTPHAVNDATGKRQLGSSAHTDFGAITLLLQDDHPGLEVQNQNTGQWIGVPPIQEAYVVNLGDMMSMLTGGQYKSSVHRVVNKGLTNRYSVVFFVDGNLDYKLQPLDKAGQVAGDDQNVLTVEEYMEDRRRVTYGLYKN